MQNEFRESCLALFADLSDSNVLVCYDIVYGHMIRISAANLVTLRHLRW